MSHIDLPYLALAARFRLLLRETGFLGMEPISIPLTSLSKLKEAIDLAERLRILQYKYSLLSSFFSASFRDLYHKLPPAVLDLSPMRNSILSLREDLQYHVAYLYGISVLNSFGFGFQVHKPSLAFLEDLLFSYLSEQGVTYCDPTGLQTLVQSFLSRWSPTYDRFYLN